MTALRQVDADVDWTSRAECAGMDASLFFPERGEATKHAKATCARCPVLDQRRTYALAHREVHGIWGGLSERERRRLRRAAGTHTRSAAVLDLLERHGAMTSADLARHLGVSVDTAAATLHHMHQQHLILRAGRHQRRWLYEIRGGGPNT